MAQSTCITTVRLLPQSATRRRLELPGYGVMPYGLCRDKMNDPHCKMRATITHVCTKQMAVFYNFKFFLAYLLRPVLDLWKPWLNFPSELKKVSLVIYSVIFVESKRRPICDESRGKHVLVVHCAKSRHHQLTIRAHHLGQVF